jgi:hypothetical protein
MAQSPASGVPDVVFRAEGVDLVRASELATACFGHPVTITRHVGRWAVVSVP